MSQASNTHAETGPQIRFEEYLRRQGLRATPERKAVLEVILNREGHFDADALLQFLRRRRRPVSRATLYRTLDHLVLAGLVKKHTFGGGHAQYEHIYNRKHHDHMVCEKCGTVIEFVNEDIERLQEQMCKDHDFIPTNHVMEIFGLCAACQKKKPA